MVLFSFMQFLSQALIISLIPMVSWGIMWALVTKATRKMEAFQSQLLFQLTGIPMLLVLLLFFPHITGKLNVPIIIVGLGVLETFVLTLYFYALQIGELAVLGPISKAYLLVTVFLAV